MWSVGCIIHEIMTEEVPGSIVSGAFKQGPLWRVPSERMERNGISRAGIRFVQWLMMPQPEDRPTAEKALNDKWLEETRRSQVFSDISIGGLGLSGVMLDFPEEQESSGGRHSRHQASASK